MDAGKADERLQLLAEVGKLRMALEVERGGVSLPIPEQEVVEDGETFAAGVPGDAARWSRGTSRSR